mgnify:CR=1 FL=1
MAQFFIPAGNRYATTDIDQSTIDLLARYSDEYIVFIGAQFERQADIIIFSQNAVHIIEVKDKRGTITVDEKGKWWVDGEPISNQFAGREETPVIQAENTASALEQFLRKVYRKRGKKFNAKVFPYVLIPHANQETRSNLRAIRPGWVWLVTSLDDLPNAIAKRDKHAIRGRNFAFDPEDIRYIARELRMAQTDEINGVRIPAGSAPASPGALQQQEVSPTAQEKIVPVSPTARTRRQEKQQKWALWPALAASILLCCLGISLLALSFTALNGLQGILPERERPIILSPSPTLAPTSAPVPTVIPSPTQVLFPSPMPIQSSSPTPLPSPTLLPSPTPSPSPTPTLSPSPVLAEFRQEKNGLVLSVEKVEILNNRFRVWMSVTNQTNGLVSLPLFKNFFVIDNLGNQYEADPFSSTLPQDIAPGATVSGYADIPQPLDGNATSIKVMFNHIFGSLNFPYPTSIAIEGIPVR